MTRLHFDCLIIGSGLAGLYAAHLASQKGRVAVVTKSSLEISNSYRAQGGIAAAVGENDSPELHFADTVDAGRGLCRSESVRILVNEGIERVNELMEMGMPFDSIDGVISLGLEGGHSKRRVLHSGGDATGKKMVEFISQFVLQNENIMVIENTYVYEILVHDGRCVGARGYDRHNFENIIMTADATIIASGGAAAIYSLSTNPHTSVGEGIALAYEAGAEIESMEFMQFHPTSFYHESGDTFLVSEAVRGEGAYIVNEKDERFLFDYVKEGELAPRDEVSKAIHFELEKSGRTNVFLKLDHLDPLKIRTRFGSIFNEAMNYGIDITKDPVPVAPAAHYTIGGIRSGISGQTNIPGLYTLGETASTGVHGANRLASNSLLECLVFGKRAVDFIFENDKAGKIQQPGEVKFHVDNSKERNFSFSKNHISNLLTYRAGIIRSAEGLREIENELDRLREMTSAEIEYFDFRLRSLITVSNLLVRSALLREESRGSHIRSDFPAESRNWEKTIILKKNSEPVFLSVS